jgi:hypothetical protein
MWAYTIRKTGWYSPTATEAADRIDSTGEGQPAEAPSREALERHPTATNTVERHPTATNTEQQEPAKVTGEAGRQHRRKVGVTVAWFKDTCARGACNEMTSNCVAQQLV